MPQVFKIAGYWVYFWSDEGKPRAYPRPYLKRKAIFKCHKNLDYEQGKMYPRTQ